MALPTTPTPTQLHEPGPVFDLSQLTQAQRDSLLATLQEQDRQNAFSTPASPSATSHVPSYVGDLSEISPLPSDPDQLPRGVVFAKYMQHHGVLLDRAWIPPIPPPIHVPAATLNNRPTAAGRPTRYAVAGLAAPPSLSRRAPPASLPISPSLGRQRRSLPPPHHREQQQPHHQQQHPQERQQLEPSLAALVAQHEAYLAEMLDHQRRVVDLDAKCRRLEVEMTIVITAAGPAGSEVATAAVVAAHVAHAAASEQDEDEAAAAADGTPAAADVHAAAAQPA